MSALSLLLNTACNNAVRPVNEVSNNQNIIYAVQRDKQSVLMSEFIYHVY